MKVTTSDSSLARPCQLVPMSNSSQSKVEVNSVQFKAALSLRNCGLQIRNYWNFDLMSVRPQIWRLIAVWICKVTTTTLAWYSEHYRVVLRSSTPVCWSFAGVPLRLFYWSVEWSATPTFGLEWEWSTTPNFARVVVGVVQLQLHSTLWHYVIFLVKLLIVASKCKTTSQSNQILSYRA